MKRSRYLAILISLAGIVCIVIGGVFIFQSVSKYYLIKDSLQAEQITLGLSDVQIAAGDVVDTADEAMKASEIINGHRQNIAATYTELLAGGQYDPANPLHLKYSHAMNMENALNLAVLSFGVSTALLGMGVFMILVGGVIIIAGMFFRANRIVA